MDSYVVRIYRRDAQNPQKIIGSVEVVAHENKEESTFSDFNELQSILSRSCENGFAGRQVAAKRKKESVRKRKE